MFLGFDFFLSFAIGLGTRVLLSLLTPKPKNKEKPPDTPKAEYGEVLIVPYNLARINGGHFAWAKKVRKKKRKKGGFFGLGGQKYNEYYGTWLVAFCDGSRPVGRVWVNKKLKSGFDFLNGQHDQPADSTIVEYEGAGETPAYRNLTSLRLKDFKLADYGNSYPSMDLEFLNSGYVLGSTIEDVCKRAKLKDSEVWVSPDIYNTPFRGGKLTQDGSGYRDFLEDCQQAHYFLKSEEDGQIKFFPAPKPELVNLIIPENVLGARDYGQQVIPRFEESLIDFIELPSEVQIEFDNSEREYDRDSYTEQRSNVNHYNPLRISLDLTLTPSEAKSIARTLLDKAWSGQRRFKFFLPPNYACTKLHWRILVQIRGQLIPIQIDKLDVGVNYKVEIEATVYSDDVFYKDLIAPNYPNLQSLVEVGIGEAIALDIPLIDDRDGDYTIYLGAAGGDAWEDGDLFMSANAGNSYDELPIVVTNNPTGVVNVLPQTDSLPTLIDKASRIRVTLRTKVDFISITEDELLSENYLALVGNELIAFRDCNQVSDYVWEFSYLIRGCRGTEDAIANHTVGERFILLRGEESDIERMPIVVTDLGKNWKFKAVHNDQDEGNITQTTDLTVALNSIRSYAPVNLESELTGNDIKISWQGRDRRRSLWGLDSNESKNYQLEILFQSSIVRTIATTNNFYIYTENDRISDGTTTGFRVKEIGIVPGKLAAANF